MRNLRKKILPMIAAALVIMTLSYTGCSKEQKSSGTADQQSTEMQNYSSSSSSKEESKSFDDEEEIKNYLDGLWVCKENSNSSSFYKVRFFIQNIYFSWDISYSSNETLDECIKALLSTAEETAGETLKSAVQFLLQLFQSEANDKGVECQAYDDIQYNAAESSVIGSDGQTIGTVLSDGTLKCDGGIFHKDDLKDLTEAFYTAKLSICIDEYGELATYTDVKYDPISYWGKPFLISGTAELDDYFNYDYRDLEYVYYCIHITPTGGGYSDSWYIYSYRGENEELFEKLKEGPAKVTLICQGFYPDSLKEEMANLIDYWY